MKKIDELGARLSADVTALPDFASILIVEDQRFDRTRLKRLIEKLDFTTHVAEAASLEDMGTMLQLDKFDLILLDYNLPDGTGLQGLDAIRHDRKNRQAATIMITGDDQTDVAIKSLKNGCSDYITKDDLSVDSFRRAAINALQKSRLSIGFEAQDSKRQQIEAVLQQFSTECANEIKPVVSRMMRQLRDLRDAASISPAQSAERFARIEQSCMRLWDFLNDLEEYEGSDLAQAPVKSGITTGQVNRIASIDAGGADRSPDASRAAMPDRTGDSMPVVPKPRRPKSLFGRMT